MKNSNRSKIAKPRTFLACLLIVIALIEMLGQSNVPLIDVLRQDGRFEISVMPIEHFERWAWHPIGGGQWNENGRYWVRYFGFIRVVHSSGLL
ncbi:MAG: hypothetical protein JWL77_3966 [Chthonomonadaceae bacterium]|nr:hypothetical protein [Chthonomonadaceae bacterium]